MKKQNIQSDILKSLREHMGLSQAKLAEMAKVSQKTISNLERGSEEKEMHSAISRITEQLARCLHTETSVLSGKKPIAQKKENKEVSINLSSKVELNFDLVAKYYGIDKQDILDVAPLLFFIAAEKSLDKQLDDLETELTQMDKENPDEELLQDLEDRFIAHSNRDIFEKFHISNTQMPGGFKNNPFTNFLGEEVSDPRYKSQIDFTDGYGWLFHGYISYTFSSQIPDYLVCKDLLRELTLNCDTAKSALLEGIVSINDIPEELLEPKKAQDRVSWIKREYQSRINKSEKLSGNDN